MYLYWLICIKLKYFEFSFFYYEVYQDPFKGKVIADSVITTTPYSFHIHKILSILNVLSIYVPVNGRKIVEKNVHRGRTYEQNLVILLKIRAIESEGLLSQHFLQLIWNCSTKDLHNLLSMLQSSIPNTKKGQHPQKQNNKISFLFWLVVCSWFMSILRLKIYPFAVHKH